MRVTLTIVLIAGTAWTGLAMGQSTTRLPSGVYLDDAGMAAAYAASLCGMPPANLQAFRQKLDTLSPGGSGSAPYHAGEKQAIDIINGVRQNDSDTSELAQRVCPRSQAIVDRVLSVP
ncbi:hypothetical protein SAMN02800692_1484 [Luteibacter sp. UNC138MFCol5.1]|uniref:hypothetical protein n=1 Tax=Luteibacter sp. UNC138MFCol5.1 TaxID=1502774 RepID=UPI0008C27684|nr:hypothetical protein [Luteibacter sp. UNC138MFCol5.1]SEO62852.1 hypothetical protein SAMN02800692_1484 [Luteibacter sp. UNC138MFCol5.1]